MLKLRYGNCLIGAILLTLKYKRVTWKLAFRRGLIPHIHVITPSGVWHFKREQNLLPGFFKYFWFRGQITKFSDTYDPALYREKSLPKE